MKGLALILLLGVVLTLNTLDPIYYGVYDSETQKYSELGEITPSGLECELSFDLEDTETVYYFYNLGFGMISNSQNNGIIG